MLEIILEKIYLRTSISDNAKYPTLSLFHGGVNCYEFYKLTGIPMILNTSFNEHGQPTIATPRQAIDHLLHHCVDMLAIDEFIVYREFEDEEGSIGEFESEGVSLARMNRRYRGEILPEMLDYSEEKDHEVKEPLLV